MARTFGLAILMVVLGGCDDSSMKTVEGATETGGSISAGAGGAGASTATGGSGGITSPGSGGSGTDGKNPNAVNPYPGFKSEIYEQDKMWMCKPGLAKNYCLENIADATESFSVVRKTRYYDGLFSRKSDETRCTTVTVPPCSLRRRSG